MRFRLCLPNFGEGISALWLANLPDQAEAAEGSK